MTARQIGAELIATGHYARNEFDERSGRWLLKRPADASKDQTYFLFGLTQEQLAALSFRWADIPSPRCASWRASYGLALAEKPDSQEICFIPGGDYKRFIDAYLEEQGETMPDTSGELVDLGWRSCRPARGHPQLHRRTAQGAWRGVAVAALCDLRSIRRATRSLVGSEDELLTRTLRCPPTELDLR